MASIAKGTGFYSARLIQHAKDGIASTFTSSWRADGVLLWLSVVCLSTCARHSEASLPAAAWEHALTLPPRHRDVRDIPKIHRTWQTLSAPAAVHPNSHRCLFMPFDMSDAGAGKGFEVMMVRDKHSEWSEYTLYRYNVPPDKCLQLCLLPSGEQHVDSRQGVAAHLVTLRWWPDGLWLDCIQKGMLSKPACFSNWSGGCSLAQLLVQDFAGCDVDLKDRAILHPCCHSITMPCRPLLRPAKSCGLAADQIYQKMHCHHHNSCFSCLVSHASRIACCQSVSLASAA